MGAMNFLRDDRDSLHCPRLAGFIYIAGAAYIFLLDHGRPDTFVRLWVPRLTFTLGWWLAFCDKRPARTTAEILTVPRRAIGFVLALFGLLAPRFWPIQ
jgi:hypothetical protein